MLSSDACSLWNECPGTQNRQVWCCYNITFRGYAHECEIPQKGKEEMKRVMENLLIQTVCLVSGSPLSYWHSPRGLGWVRVGGRHLAENLVWSLNINHPGREARSAFSLPLTELQVPWSQRSWKVTPLRTCSSIIFHVQLAPLSKRPCRKGAKTHRAQLWTRNLHREGQSQSLMSTSKCFFSSCFHIRG